MLDHARLNLFFNNHLLRVFQDLLAFCQLRPAVSIRNVLSRLSSATECIRSLPSSPTVISWSRNLIVLAERRAQISQARTLCLSGSDG